MTKSEEKDKEDIEDIVEREMWDHYSELPNPAWYQYLQEQEEKQEEDI
jgi:hypothetical protein